MDGIVLVCAAAVTAATIGAPASIPPARVPGFGVPHAATRVDGGTLGSILTATVDKCAELCVSRVSGGASAQTESTRGGTDNHGWGREGTPLLPSSRRYPHASDGRSGRGSDVTGDESECVGFTFDTSTTNCTINGWSHTFTLVGATASTSYYPRIRRGNTSAVIPAVEYTLDVPTSGVTLMSGPLKGAVHASDACML